MRMSKNVNIVSKTLRTKRVSRSLCSLTKRMFNKKFNDKKSKNVKSKFIMKQLCLHSNTNENSKNIAKIFGKSERSNKYEVN